MLWLEQAPVKLEGPRTWFSAFPKAWPERELRRGPGLAECGRAQGGFASRPQLASGIKGVKNCEDDVSHRIHGAAIYGNMDPINIPPLC